jgi:hypothetical protein
LGNLKDIEQQLRGNALDAIIAYLAAHTCQRQPPWIDAVAFRQFGFRFVQPG